MNDPIHVYFGQTIRKYRHKLGISQEELAARANVHRTYVGMIERAEKNITLSNIEKFSRALGVPISELFDEYDDTNHTYSSQPDNL